MTNPRIAVAFFSITRSLSYTYPSIEAQAIAPARALGQTQIHAHFWQQKAIDNQRSEEKGALDLEEYRLLNADHLRLEEPVDIAGSVPFETLESWGDTFENGFQSLNNLYKQLVSLERVTQSVLDEEADICIFLRPDLTYHDSLRPLLKRALKARSGTVFLPWWQGWHGGFNDRFAICVGREAIAAYGQRLSAAPRFHAETGQPLHSEKLVRFALEEPGLSLRFFGKRATRTRIGGALHPKEIFKHPLQRKVEYRLRQIGLLRSPSE